MSALSMTAVDIVTLAPVHEAGKPHASMPGLPTTTDSLWERGDRQYGRPGSCGVSVIVWLLNVYWVFSIGVSAVIA
ncbi:hypothetical protein H3V09_01365 [Bifidobacterium sp. M0399]|nr:hypothetical protein [Bifidobacterium sp. M0399]